MINKNIKTFNKYKVGELKKTLSDKIPLIKFIYAAFILNSFNLIAVLLLQKNLPPQIPLFYGFAQSEQQLTSSFGLLIPGIYSISVVIANAIFSIFLINDFLKKILSITSFTISLLSAITVIKIVGLIGFF